MICAALSTHLLKITTSSSPLPAVVKEDDAKEENDTLPFEVETEPEKGVADAGVKKESPEDSAGSSHEEESVDKEKDDEAEEEEDDELKPLKKRNLMSMSHMASVTTGNVAFQLEVPDDINESELD